MSALDRVYKIERLIRSRGCVSFAALKAELEVSAATLKRDLAYLRDRLHAPIEYDRDRNGYAFGHGHAGPRHELPGLWFSERELYSLLMAHQLLSGLDEQGAISRQLQPMLDRIHDLLAPSEAEAKALLQRVKVIGVARRPVPAKHFELVADALLKRRRIDMRYLTRSRAQTSQREVSPQRLVHHRNTWYLDAWCHRSEGLRRFSLDAIGEARLTDTRARDVAARTLQAEMDAGYGVYAGGRRQWATLSFDPQAAQWVSREQWHPEQRGTFTADGRWRLEVPYTEETELAMDVLRHGGTVRVVAPASLRREVLRRHREALAAHGEPA